MKEELFLIKYDTQFNGEKGLLRLVYAKDYEEALLKIANDIKRYGQDVVFHTNLTIK